MPPRSGSSGRSADSDKEVIPDTRQEWKGDSMGFPGFFQDGMETLLETIEGAQAYFETGIYH